MLDRWAIKLLKKPLKGVAGKLKGFGCRPDQVSIAAFGVGIVALPALYLHIYWLALICIVLNRVGDGLDGALARMTSTSDAGGFLDIVLDFIFYSSVVLGFALTDPKSNGLAAATLLFTFVGTGSSFLAFAIMAERRGMKNTIFPQKGIYYLTGLAEGTETFIFLVLFTLFPSHFPLLAYIFSAICLVSAFARIISSYLTLRH